MNTNYHYAKHPSLSSSTTVPTNSSAVDYRRRRTSNLSSASSTISSSTASSDNYGSPSSPPPPSEALCRKDTAVPPPQEDDDDGVILPNVSLKQQNVGEEGVEVKTAVGSGSGGDGVGGEIEGNKGCIPAVAVVAVEPNVSSQSSSLVILGEVLEPAEVAEAISKRAPVVADDDETAAVVVVKKDGAPLDFVAEGGGGGNANDLPSCHGDSIVSVTPDSASAKTTPTLYAVVEEENDDDNLVQKVMEKSDKVGGAESRKETAANSVTSPLSVTLDAATAVPSPTFSADSSPQPVTAGAVVVAVSSKEEREVEATNKKEKKEEGDEEEKAADAKGDGCPSLDVTAISAVNNNADEYGEVDRDHDQDEYYCNSRGDCFGLDESRVHFGVGGHAHDDDDDDFAASPMPTLPPPPQQQQQSQCFLFNLTSNLRECGGLGGGDSPTRTPTRTMMKQHHNDHYLHYQHNHSAATNGNNMSRTSSASHRRTIVVAATTTVDHITTTNNNSSNAVSAHNYSSTSNGLDTILAQHTTRAGGARNPYATSTVETLASRRAKANSSHMMNHNAAVSNNSNANPKNNITNNNASNTAMISPPAVRSPSLSSFSSSSHRRSSSGSANKGSDAGNSPSSPKAATSAKASTVGSLAATATVATAALLVTFALGLETAADSTSTDGISSSSLPSSAPQQSHDRRQASTIHNNNVWSLVNKEQTVYERLAAEDALAAITTATMASSQEASDDTNKPANANAPPTVILPKGRMGHAACVVNRKMYVYGGLHGIPPKAVREVKEGGGGGSSGGKEGGQKRSCGHSHDDDHGHSHGHDEEEGTKCAADTSASTYSSSSAPLSRFENPSSSPTSIILDDLWSYDPRTGLWEEIDYYGIAAADASTTNTTATTTDSAASSSSASAPQFPGGRLHHSLVSLRDGRHFMLYGGFNNETSQELHGSHGDMWRFDVVEKKWELVEYNRAATRSVYDAKKQIEDQIQAEERKVFEAKKSAALEKKRDVKRDALVKEKIKAIVDKNKGIRERNQKRALLRDEREKQIALAKAVAEEKKAKAAAATREKEAQKEKEDKEAADAKAKAKAEAEEKTQTEQKKEADKAADNADDDNAAKKKKDADTTTKGSSSGGGGEDGDECAEGDPDCVEVDEEEEAEEAAVVEKNKNETKEVNATNTTSKTPNAATTNADDDEYEEVDDEGEEDGKEEEALDPSVPIPPPVEDDETIADDDDLPASPSTTDIKALRPRLLTEEDEKNIIAKITLDATDGFVPLFYRAPRARSVYPSSRGAHEAILSPTGDALLVFGGHDKVYSDPSNELWRFDLSGRYWEELTPRNESFPHTPSRRVGFSFASVASSDRSSVNSDGSAYLFGGTCVQKSPTEENGQCGDTWELVVKQKKEEKEKEGTDASASSSSSSLSYQQHVAEWRFINTTAPIGSPLVNFPPSYAPRARRAGHSLVCVDGTIPSTTADTNNSNTSNTLEVNATISLTADLSLNNTNASSSPSSSSSSTPLCFLFGGVYLNNNDVSGNGNFLMNDLWGFNTMEEDSNTRNGAAAAVKKNSDATASPFVDRRRVWSPLFPNYGRGPKPRPTFGHTVVAVNVADHDDADDAVEAGGKKKEQKQQQTRLIVFGGRHDTLNHAGSNELWEFIV